MFVCPSYEISRLAWLVSRNGNHDFGGFLVILPVMFVKSLS